MPVTVKIHPTSEIKAHLGIDPNGRVQKFFTKNCYKHMDKYVPYEYGNLRTVVDLTSNKITYRSPYAKYQYYGIRADGTHKVTHYTTPGTGTYWDKRMWSAESQNVVEETQKYIGGK